MPIAGITLLCSRTVGFQYYHLHESDVRAHMLDAWRGEWADLSANWPRERWPYGKQLTDAGWAAFEQAMPEALASKDDDWLASEMKLVAYWLDRSPRKTKNGITMVNYNKQDALERLCFGEFNIAYIRGLALALLAREETTCLVYRADPAYEPRAECSGWEGQTFPLADVVAGHRARYFPPPGEQTAFSVPTGPNCHHSIQAVAP
jgi:hypothetical protein